MLSWAEPTVARATMEARVKVFMLAGDAIDVTDSD